MQKSPIEHIFSEAEEALTHQGYDKASDRTVILAGFSYLARVIKESGNAGRHSNNSTKRRMVINVGLPIIGGGAFLAWIMEIIKAMASR